MISVPPPATYVPPASSAAGNSNHQPTVFELTPNHKLIDAKFESYKLSLSPLASYKTPIECGLTQVEADPDMFSYEKTRCLFAHNYLTLDPWYKENVFFVDKSAQVRRFHVLLEAHMVMPQAVFVLEGILRASGKLRLPPSMLFPSPTLAVASDGCGMWYVLDTGERKLRDAQKWTELYQDVGPSASVLLDAVYRVTDDGEYLDVVLVRFEDRTPDHLKSDEVTIVVIEWASLRWNSTLFELISTRTFEGKSFPYFASVSAGDLCVASKHPFKYMPAWEGESISDELPPDNSPEAPKPRAYKWKQTTEDVTVMIELSPGVDTKDVICSISPKNINVAIRSDEAADPTVILTGSLFLDADPEASSWTVSNHMLEVIIQKRVEDCTWPQVVYGDNRGEMVVDSEEAARIHERLAHLTSDQEDPDPDGGELFNSNQLEECDVYHQSTATLACFDASTDCFKTCADISDLKWLFNCHLASGEPHALVLRHNVDAIVWQPCEQSWRHTATFNALGYVHASKTNVKFASCSPDTSFAALADCQRHVYIYRQPTVLRQQSLKNRASGERVATVSTQQVATLDGNDDIVGFACSDDRMYVLTSAPELVVFKVSMNEGV